jgi:hypothetical protein
MSIWLLILLALLEVGWAPRHDAAYVHWRLYSVPVTEPRFAVGKGPAWSNIAQPQRDSARPLGYGAGAEPYARWHLRLPTRGASSLMLGHQSREQSGTLVSALAPPDSQGPTPTGLERVARGVPRVAENVSAIGRGGDPEQLTTLPPTTTQPAPSSAIQPATGAGCRRAALGRAIPPMHFCNSL